MMRLSNVSVGGIGRGLGTIVVIGVSMSVAMGSSIVVSSVTLSAQQADVPRLRIATAAVEIDAVVTDRGGRQIADLQPEEFELYQDGRKQRISSIRYVSAGRVAPAASGPGAPAAPAIGGGSKERRTVAIVIDDLTMSFASTVWTREALRRFVDRHVQPDDLVSVIRTTEEGVRTQRFSGDKAALLAAVRKVKYNIDAPDRHNRIAASAGIADVPWAQSEAFTLGTLGTVNAVVRAMRSMPGRKAVLLATDGFRLTHDDHDQFYNVNLRLTQAMQQLADDATRAFVVLYTLNTRRVAEPDAIVTQTSAGARTAFIPMFPIEDEDGPEYLARIGGGFHLRHASSLEQQFARVLDDQSGYYLLTYEPDEATFKYEGKGRPDFHDVKVQVTRKGARVRSRPGFFGVSDEELRRHAKDEY